ATIRRSSGRNVISGLPRSAIDRLAIESARAPRGPAPPPAPRAAGAGDLAWARNFRSFTYVRPTQATVSPNTTIRAAHVSAVGDVIPETALTITGKAYQ